MFGIDSLQQRRVLEKQSELAEFATALKVEPSATRRIKQRVEKAFTPPEKSKAFFKYIALLLLVSTLALVAKPGQSSAKDFEGIEEPDIVTVDNDSADEDIDVVENESIFTEERLTENIDAIIANSPGEWNVLITEVGGSPIYEHNELDPFHPGSVVKVPIAIAVVHYLEQNSSNLETALQETPLGSSLTWSELIEAMIVDSSEDATETLVNLVGIDEINSLFGDFGFEDTSIAPRRSTANDLTNAFEFLVTDQSGISQEGKEVILSFMNVASSREMDTGAVLPDSELPGHYHKRGMVVQEDLIMGGDTAFIRLANGSEYIISATGTFESREDFLAARTVIPEISQEAFDFFDNEQAQTRIDSWENPGSGFSIDTSHATIARLFNLLQVEQQLDGYVIQPGETFSFNGTINLQNAQNFYMDAETYTASGVISSPGGGVCGAASALGTEAEKVGLSVSFDGGNHLETAHTAGGLYYGLENISVYSLNGNDTDLRITNTTDQPITIHISTNFDYDTIDVDPDNWSVSADRAGDYLPPLNTGREAFTFELSFESNGTEMPYITENPLIENWPLDQSFAEYANGDSAPVELQNLPNFAVDLIDDLISQALSSGEMSRQDAFEAGMSLWQFAFPDGDTNPAVRTDIQSDVFNAMYGGNDDWQLIDVWQTWKTGINGQQE